MFDKKVELRVLAGPCSGKKVILSRKGTSLKVRGPETNWRGKMKERMIPFENLRVQYCSQEQRGHGLMGAAIGGLLAGPVGAVVGGVAGSSPGPTEHILLEWDDGGPVLNRMILGIPVFRGQQRKAYEKLVRMLA